MIILQEDPLVTELMDAIQLLRNFIHCSPAVKVIWGFFLIFKVNLPKLQVSVLELFQVQLLCCGKITRMFSFWKNR